MALIDWHDFVVVEAIEFVDGEEFTLPPPISQEELIRKSKQLGMEEELQAEAEAAALAAGKEVKKTKPMDEEERRLVEESMRGGEEGRGRGQPRRGLPRKWHPRRQRTGRPHLQRCVCSLGLVFPFLVARFFQAVALAWLWLWLWLWLQWGSWCGVVWGCVVPCRRMMRRWTWRRTTPRCGSSRTGNAPRSGQRQRWTPPKWWCPRSQGSLFRLRRWRSTCAFR